MRQDGWARLGVGVGVGVAPWANPDPVPGPIAHHDLRRLARCLEHLVGVSVRGRVLVKKKDRVRVKCMVSVSCRSNMSRDGWKLMSPRLVANTVQACRNAE